MSERSRERKNRVIATIASLALVVGLLPVPALAAADPGESPVDSPSAAVPAVEPAAPTDEPSKVAAPVEEPSEAAAPAEEESNATIPVEEPSRAAAPAEESSRAAAPSEGTGKAPVVEHPAFKQSRTVDGVAVTVEADAGAFPEGAGLSVTAVPSSRTEAAVALERAAGENVTASYTFDIKVLDKDGEEVQPANGKSVKVSFATAEVADPNLEVSVYHVSGGTAEELSVSESGSTATAQSTGFSYYTVEFTYNDLCYVLQGGSAVPLADILAKVGLQGEPEAAESSDPELFGVARDENGAWTVTANQAFSTPETLTVVINGAEYRIAVTDEQSSTCGDGVTYAISNGVIMISYTGIGTGKMENFSSEGAPWYGSRESIMTVGIEYGVTSIGDRAFEACDHLESVTIPSSVTSIGELAFGGCTFLKSVTIPDGVTSIGKLAFNTCSSLKSITIPSSVTSIGGGAFNWCPQLADIYYSGTKEDWETVAGGATTVPANATIHYGCGDGVYYTLDSGTLTISKVGDGTGMMDDYYDQRSPWSYGYDVESVVIGDGVTSIGNCAFKFCSSLRDVKIPDSVTFIGNLAFCACESLSSMAFDGSKAQWDYKVKKGSDWNDGAGVREPTSYAKWGVAALASPAAGGTVNGEAVFVASFDKGAAGTVTLEAAPSEGYRFTGWTEGATQVSTDNVYTIEEVTSDRELTAHFVPAAPKITGQPEDLSWTYGDDAERTLSVTADVAGYTLSYQWYQNASASSTGGTKVDGETGSSYTVPSGTQMDAGTYYYYCVVTNTKDGESATAASQVAAVTVDKAPLTITARDQTYDYNGQTQGEGDTTYEVAAEIAEKVKVEGLQGEDALTGITLDGQGKDVGEYELVPSNAVIGENTGNYAITFKNGTLTIEPASATVTTGSATKTYDGKPLTDAEASIAGLVNGETATVTATGSQTEVGSSANTYSIEWGTADAKNYTVTDKLGTLTVEAVPRLYTVTWLNYDGTELYEDVKVPYGTMPKFEGATPAKPSDDRYTYEFAGWEPEIAEVTGDATYTAKYTATPKDKPVYKVVSGANGSWTEGSGEPMVFKIERTVDPETAFSHFTGINVDGKAVPEKDASGKVNWTARSGSVIVELQPSYLATLSEGEHMLTAFFDDSDSVTAEFKVAAKASPSPDKPAKGTSPKTGDPLAGAFVVTIATAIIAFILMIAFAVRRRRA